MLHPQLYGYMESEPLTLQLFIGTADDRLLRPHAFYQVHRITGKTVSTASHEVLQSNTKVLEIPLLPENNMRALIDCAGILKLRNSDIELRKGETDIGRKNTRVRMVFRVHINQANGRTVSLQVASNPIECSQRSAQELPLIEKQSADSYPATGGKKMLLTGHNFQPDSKVVFVEKGQGRLPPWMPTQMSHQLPPLQDKYFGEEYYSRRWQEFSPSAALGEELPSLQCYVSDHTVYGDQRVEEILFSRLNKRSSSQSSCREAANGHHLWETEAKVDKDSLKPTSMVVEIPPYRNQRISSPVQVNFYVCNGKRKRSQYQRFTYLSPNEYIPTDGCI
ncbi:hypothetical protein Z043_101635 [Scleropages formosus]|uniref:RHD domain-containing protein n=1 Tax=Scleropages formosus TaxID=113540 RepID=A0A0P7VR67_SCLFO|nr:hypothetical protein Z043_101635 [Scleropages formosus]